MRRIEQLKKNNAAIKFPHLIPEWDPNNKLTLYDYFPSSKEKVNWICTSGDECHKWSTTILYRTANPHYSCPFCSGRQPCKHNNVEITNPELIPEWSPRNKLPMSAYAQNSYKKVWWICSRATCDDHEWLAAVGERAGHKKTQCPFCASRKLCKHNTLEYLRHDLIPEWHPDNKPMNTFTISSKYKALWICPISPCECHTYYARIDMRAGTRNTGCPYCNINKWCPHNNLEAKFPELIPEWHPDNPMPMCSYTINSQERVLWKCSKSLCECHVWETPICYRTCPDKNGCPYCNHGKVCPHSNLETKRPELKCEWSSKNEREMSSYTVSAHDYVWWICSKNKHEWQAEIRNRTGPDKNGCPYCTTAGYSKFQIKWLNEVMKKENIHIMHAENGGEFKIEGVGKVDGYCKETNTCFEAHGTWYHGSPDYYKPEDIHPVSKKPFGVLYNKTLERDNKIRKLGYNLVVMWEHDYKPIGKRKLKNSKHDNLELIDDQHCILALQNITKEDTSFNAEVHPTTENSSKREWFNEADNVKICDEEDLSNNTDEIVDQVIEYLKQQFQGNIKLAKVASTTLQRPNMNEQELTRKLKECVIKNNYKDVLVIQNKIIQLNKEYGLKSYKDFDKCTKPMYDKAKKSECYIGLVKNMGWINKL